MLLHLANFLSQYQSDFQVVNYLTLRVIFRRPHFIDALFVARAMDDSASCRGTDRTIRAR